MINHCCYIDDEGAECTLVAVFEIRGVGFENTTDACVKHLHLMVGDDEEVFIVTAAGGRYEQNLFEMAYGSEERWRGAWAFRLRHEDMKP